MTAFGTSTVAVVGLLVGAAVTAVACGGDRPAAPASAPAGATPRPAIPVESCAAPAADPVLVRDRYLDGALTIGPLVIYPADDIGPAQRLRRGAVRAPKVVVINTAARPVTLAVGRGARARFSLLFAGASTGSPTRGFRVSDGIPAVRFPACGNRSMGFRGGFLYRGAPCVPIAVHPAGALALRATIAVGRPLRSCRGR